MLFKSSFLVVSVAFQVNPAVVAENVGSVTANAVLTGEIERSVSVR